MAWTLRPGNRDDIVFEGKLALNGSGTYDDDSVWLESSTAKNLRVSVRFNNFSGSPQFTICEAVHVDGSDMNGGPFEVRSHTLSLISGRGYQELEISARFFRFVASGGGAGETVYVTARSVN